MAANVFRSPKYRRVIGNSDANAQVDTNLDVLGNLAVTGTSVFTGAATFTASPVFNASVGLKYPVISGQGATATLTAAQTGSIVLFDRAAGIIYTLPAPSPGLNFTFITTVSVTSNNDKVITDAGTTLLIGSIWEAVAAGTGTEFIGNGTTHIAVVSNGTTSGGLIGSVLYFYSVTGTLWEVTGTELASGTIVTPFSTT